MKFFTTAKKDLDTAIQAGDVASVKKLINSGVAIKTKNFDYRVAAELAYRENNLPSHKTNAQEIFRFLNMAQHTANHANQKSTIPVHPRSPRAGR